VSPAAASVGGYGMQAVINDNHSIYVTDDSPNAEPRYGARFYFNMNSIAMTSGNAHYIFYGLSGSSTAVLRIELRFSSAAYQLRTGLLNDSNVWQDTSWFTISNPAWHALEVDWQAATAPNANDGSLAFWIDGSQQAIITAVDNDTRRIDRVRLGPVAGIDTRTRGTYYFEEFESRRRTYIGP